MLKIQTWDSLTLAATKLPPATLTPTSCHRVLCPCRRRFNKGGPGESFASILNLTLPAASIATSNELESVIR